MPSTRSVETGQRPTKYKCYLGFYDLSKIQGWFIGSLLKMTGLSCITHVGPIIQTKTQGEITITICAATSRNGRRSSVAKVHSTTTLEQLGAILVDKIYVGEIEMDIDNVVEHAKNYTDISAWDLIFHNFIGRFLGLTRPRMCTTFVCKIFNLPETWHPVTLWRRYDNTAIGRSS